jgi:hypothetical protein
VAQKLLGLPTIARGECPGRGWWWRESQESNTPPSHPECTKTAKKLVVSRTPRLGNPRKCCFLIKSTPETFLKEYIDDKILLLKALLNYTCSKSYTPPATRIRVLKKFCHFSHSNFFPCCKIFTNYKKKSEEGYRFQNFPTLFSWGYKEFF